MYTAFHSMPGPWRGRPAISPRPRGGDWLEDELKAWRASGVDIVVSLLTPQEADDLGLAKERRYREASGMRFIAFPIEDQAVPERKQSATELQQALSKELGDGKNVVADCRQGIGRAGLIASMLLIQGGLSAEQAMRRVSDARGVEVPETEERRLWLRNLENRA